MLDWLIAKIKSRNNRSNRAPEVIPAQRPILTPLPPLQLESYTFLTANLIDFRISEINLPSLKLDFTRDDSLCLPEGDNAFDHLPAEIKVTILGNLSMQELCRIALVSRHWKHLSSLNVLWERFVKSDTFLGWDPYSTKTYKEEYKSKYLLKCDLFQLGRKNKDFLYYDPDKLNLDNVITVRR